MKKSISVNSIAMNAMIAGVYAALTFALSPIAYLEIQCRLSEVMVLLAFYNRKFIPGLVVGCFIANIPSPLGLMDMTFGTLSTLLVCIAIYYCKNRYVAAFIGAIITGVIIGIELHIAFNIPLVLNIIYVAIGEFVVLLLGALAFKQIEQHSFFKKYIQE